MWVLGTEQALLQKQQVLVPAKPALSAAHYMVFNLCVCVCSRDTGCKVEAVVGRAGKV